MAGKTVRALVKPDILVWARESTGFTLEEVAASAGLSKVAAWESGDIQPTINQLRTLGRKYKRPLAVFYLQERPEGFQVIRDFRRLPGEGLRRLSPQLTLQIRAAQERREIALDLLDEVGEEAPVLSLNASMQDDPENVGARIRAFLKVSEQEQRSWKTNREAFNAWRMHIENAGVLVFQMDKIPSTEASGFAIAEPRLPVIAVNRGDALSRRIFTLLHEFAHLLLRESGVSDFEIEVHRPPEEQKVEVFCNAVAAATVFPKSMFVSEQIVREHGKKDALWEEEEINELADIFSMSKVSIVRRLLTLGLTNNGFYKRKEEQYSDEYQEWLKKRKAEYQDKEFAGRNMPNEALSLLGRSYIRMILAPYHGDRITLRDVSAYLNLKTRHIPKVEQVLLGEVTA